MNNMGSICAKENVTETCSVNKREDVSNVPAEGERSYIVSYRYRTALMSDMKKDTIINMIGHCGLKNGGIKEKKLLKMIQSAYQKNIGKSFKVDIRDQGGIYGRLDVVCCNMSYDALKNIIEIVSTVKDLDRVYLRRDWSPGVCIISDSFNYRC